MASSTPIKDFIRGDTRTINIVVKDSKGVPIDITGGKVFFTLSSTEDPASDSGALISKTQSSHIDAANGESSIKILPEDTASIAPGEYFYDIQFVDSSGNVTSRQQSTFEIIADITRRTT